MTRHYTITKIPPKEKRCKVRSIRAELFKAQRSQDVSPVVTLTADEIVAKAANTLLAIMNIEKNNADICIRAAKALLLTAREIRFMTQARHDRKEGETFAENDEARRNEKEERAAAIADARAVLAEIAETKTGRMAEPRAVDHNGAAGADHAAG